jgi:imidazolonepropionase-like amidohydrolase
MSRQRHLNSSRPTFYVCWLVALLLTLTANALAQITAVRAGRLIDPATGAIQQNQVLLIEGGKIKEVGANLAIPPGASVVDLSRETVLPGLFDCHTHLCLTMIPPRGPSDREFYEALQATITTKSTAKRALEGAAHARTMLEAGFTTVRDVGNAGNYADTDLRYAIEEGLLPGPTIVNAGRIIAPFGGQLALVIPHEHHDLNNPEYFYADTHDELIKAVRANIFYGAKLIKLVVDDEPYIYSVEDIKLVVQEAAKAGLKVAAHGYTRQGARNAIEAGVASVEHGYDMTDDDLRLAKQKGVTLVGTDRSEVVYRTLQVPLDSQAKRLDRLKRAWKIGVPMAFGTDLYFDVPGYTRATAALSCLECYVKAGIPAPGILRLMTTDAARLVGIEAERGAARPGLYADLIATPGNPLEDIRALQRVDFVMKNGVVVRQRQATAAH